MSIYVQMWITDRFYLANSPKNTTFVSSLYLNIYHLTKLIAEVSIITKQAEPFTQLIKMYITCVNQSNQEQPRFSQGSVLISVVQVHVVHLM